MELKAGYKQTEVGVVPAEWDVKVLGDLGRVVRGGSPRPAGDPRYFNGDFTPWLTVAALTNIPDHCLNVSETVSMLTEEGAKRSRTLSEGTLIIANSGATLGVAKLLTVTCCANDGIAAIVDQRLGHKPFVCHYINAKTKRLREVVATGNGQPNLNTRLIREITVPFPPLPEQGAIAAVLSDVDALLGGLDRLVAKKRDVKTAAMQQVLTGQTRLPGYSVEWNLTTLGQLVDIKRGELITERDVVPGPIPVIAGGRQPAHFHHSANRTGKSITISASGASAGFVGFHTTPIFASDCSTIGEGPDYCIEFLYHLLQSKQEEIYRSQTGGAQPHVHPSDLEPMAVCIPSKPEQTAIAVVLSDMDGEIAALERRRAKTRDLKQAMMQELLTGRTRLV